MTVYVHFSYFIELTINSHTNPYILPLRCPVLSLGTLWKWLFIFATNNRSGTEIDCNLRNWFKCFTFFPWLWSGKIAFYCLFSLCENHLTSSSWYSRLVYEKRYLVLTSTQHWPKNAEVPMTKPLLKPVLSFFSVCFERGVYRVRTVNSKHS